MKYNPYSAASIQLFEATMAVSWEDVCRSSIFATEYMVLELFLN